MNYFTCFLLLTISIIWVFGNDDNIYDDFDDYDTNDDDDDDDDRIKLMNSTTNSTIIFVQPSKNLTVEPGRKTVKFICDVKNVLTINDISNTSLPKIVFKWEKNFVEIEKSKKFSIHNERLKPPPPPHDNNNNNNNNNNNEIIYRSILRIKNIEFFDKSMYDCIADNGIDIIKQQYFLDVDRDPKWGITSSLNLNNNNNINKLNIDVTTLIPDGTKIGFNIDDNNGGKTFDLPPSGKIPIPQRTFSDSGGGNSNNNNNNNNTIEPFCQIYNGHTCRHYLTNKYVFVQPPYTQKEIEDKLRNAFLVISQSNDISPSCNKLAHPSLCYSAFPLCIDPKTVNLYQIKHYKRQLLLLFNNNNINYTNIRGELTDNLQRICKDDCLLLETELCSKEYAIAKRHPVIGQTLELEECQYLPDETEESSKNCLSLGIDNQSDKNDKCYWDNGILYRGIKNISETGRTCLRWSHQIHIPISQYPELTGHNYCRNPGGISTQPFCYIDQNKRELCDITKCAHVAAIYIIGIIVVIAALASVLIGLFCCRKKIKPRNIQNISIPLADKNIYGNPGPHSPIELNSLLPPNIPPLPSHHHHHPQPHQLQQQQQQQKRCNQSKNNYQNVPQYTYKEVSFIEELGEGAFGKVYKGELKLSNKNGGKIIVAVKSLKENANAKTQADFQREIELISELKHPNIICLLGIVIKQEPMCMLFEFMSEGDLHEFLITNSPSEGKSLTQNQFLHIAIQIAQGMEYLSENHYVHRDLAARNCLVSHDFIVKISDFGLSRDMYSCDYYRVQSKSLLPVRWMPPESILYGKFTTESDVWSYGVVLWEIYSYGLQPYYGYNNQEVINMIRSRKLLPCPDACPSYCYSLMIECWAELAIRRPSFPEITHRLKVWKQNGSATIQNGAYFKTIPTTLVAQQQQQKFGHCSKDNQECSLTTTPSTTWERNCRLNESQTSLTSRSSSLGNRTQSTNLSNEQQNNTKQQQRFNNRKRNNDDSLDRNPNLKNTIVNSTNGDNFEIKITTTN